MRVVVVSAMAGGGATARHEYSRSLVGRHASGSEFLNAGMVWVKSALSWRALRPLVNPDRSRVPFHKPQLFRVPCSVRRTARVAGVTRGAARQWRS